jgi:hypothetical protein
MSRKPGLFDSAWSFFSAAFLVVMGWVIIVFVFRVFTGKVTL